MQDSLITGRLLIDGELVESEGAGWVDSINPANEQIIGRAPAGTRRDVERAVDAARRAWPAWAERTGEERGELLRVGGGQQEL
ncbi:aldehyde dehydrogenase family protein, partial [Pseudomonas aeruginosa]|uniref:aldehyde dehydrogenase family protein n=1 Tax=Pseudomonas aeruginosa TaxID=287 RepID=UPI0031B67F47